MLILNYFSLIEPLPCWKQGEKGSFIQKPPQSNYFFVKYANFFTKKAFLAAQMP